MLSWGKYVEQFSLLFYIVNVNCISKILGYHRCSACLFDKQRVIEFD